MLPRQPYSRLAASLGTATRSPLLRPYTTSSSSSSSSSVNVNVKTAFASVALLTSAYLLYQYESGSGPFSLPVHKSTFKVNIQTGRGGVQTYEFARKPADQVERELRQHESSQTVGRRGNPVMRWDSNWVGSNEPCEDRWAADLVPKACRSRRLVQETVGFWKGWYKGDAIDVPASASASASASTSTREEEGEGNGDWMLFSIMDGHAGDATSSLLAKTLHPTLSMALASLQAGNLPARQNDGWGWGRWGLGWLGLGNDVWTPENVSKTIENAFVQLDDNICQTPIQLLPTLSSPSPSPSPSASASETLVALAQPAAAGACAISTLVDSENNDIYVAVTGDCRAVAGWEGKDGIWRCDVLSEDQMGDNPREVERMRKEHPASERDTVIRNGRVQGGLQPTRAFGDAVYKWTNAQAAQIAEAFEAEGGKPRAGRPWNYTPPYVTARPKVTYRKLDSETGEKLRFIVLATDGLWDRITSEESTLLVASYLAHPSHKPLPKSSLLKRFPLAAPPPPSARPYPAQDLCAPTGEAARDTWVYEGDGNAATHLIRNSLAGGDVTMRGELMSLSGKVSRWMRDDITVTVVFFNDD
ncbi:uncharacterized protein IAS62_002010 [Cryptococcus decagattii]|uniref:PPM-type phosphatase domain-containing protein n=1 Tax=Cryptococcus decagattii TaxID=1859122 RepID=A0ABZ2AQC5_9TREE